MIEKVKSNQAQEWMHVRRLKHGEVRQWVKENESDAWTMTTRMVALCLCDKTGKSPFLSTEEAIKAVEELDWELVRDIDQQAHEINGLDKRVKDAEKNS